MAKKKIKIKWLSESEGHDYPAAKSYLSLIYDESAAEFVCGAVKARSNFGIQIEGYFQGFGAITTRYQQR